MSKSSCQAQYIDTRELIRKLILPNSKLVQFLFTELICKPHLEQYPLFVKTVIGQLFEKIILLSLGLILSKNSVNIGCFGIIFIIFVWAINLHVLRWFRLTFQHACSHKTAFRKNPYLNSVVGEIISILTLSGDFRSYSEGGHLKIHHLINAHPTTSSLMKYGDETYEYLIQEVGFKPGASVEDLWFHLWLTLFSPKFHTQRFFKRLRQTFLSPYFNHNIAAFLFWISIGTLVTVNHAWNSFLIALGVPLSVGFEASSLLRQCVEHSFPNPPTEKRDREVLSQMTGAIFLAELPPQLAFDAYLHERFFAWIYWWIRMLGYHLPSRLLILTGDSPIHDWHHRHPSGNWANSIYERQKDLEAGCPEWGSYLESYGLLEAIGATFRSLSLQPSNSNMLRSGGGVVMWGASENGKLSNFGDVAKL